MQYLANLSVQDPCMPGVPIPRIPQGNLDVPVPSSGNGRHTSTSLAQRKVASSHLTTYHVASSKVSPNHFTSAIGLHVNLNSKQGVAWSSKTRDLHHDSEGPVPLRSSLSVHESSADSEHDLAQMVHDYMEYGSHRIDSHECNIDGKHNAQIDLEHSQTLQGLVSNTTFLEKELLSAITMVNLSTDEGDLVCQDYTPAATSSKCCKGSCIRWLLVKRLRLLGYDAGVCRVKWPNSRKGPGGEYEYIDVIFDSNSRFSGRIVIDIDFQSQFQIARATQSYLMALRSLPIIFVGSLAKLSRILHVTAKAIKLSLKQNGMPVPPWRTLDYMTCKWMSPCERLINMLDIGESICDQHTRANKLCIAQLHCMKSCMSANLSGLYGKNDGVVARSSSSMT